jgi:hypothetical protein
MNPEKEKLFESATRSLVALADRMDLGGRAANMRLKNLTLLFRDSFKVEDIRNFVFSPYLSQSEIKLLDYPSIGLCKTHKALFALGGGAPWSLELRYIDGDIWTHGSHYFLRHKKSGEVFDITFDQFALFNITVPYELSSRVPLMLEKNDIALRFTEKIGIDLMKEIKGNKRE